MQRSAAAGSPGSWRLDVTGHQSGSRTHVSTEPGLPWLSGHPCTQTRTRARPENVLILSGDHIYKMDYEHMVLEHLMNDAAITIGAVPVPVEESRRFGILRCDDRERVLGFQEKPGRHRSCRTGRASASGRWGSRAAGLRR